MGADQNLDWQRLAASALDWWRDAGVDIVVEDRATDWLTPAATPEPALAAPAPARLPATIEAFLTWRTGAAVPEAGWHGSAIAASGPATADLMVLVDCPEPDDRACLLEGAAGRLFDRMLAAIGRSRADIHLAAVCMRRPIGGRSPRESSEALAALARHHVELAAPQRLLALGDAASRAMGAAEVPRARGRLHLLNHKDGKPTQMVASWHPRELLRRPQLKAEAWGDLQMLIGGVAQ